MGDHEPQTEHRSFGHYLRRIRERRKLSLDAVEELSTGFPERVTKSHLSRIENGQAVPSFPRMFALSRIYGVPIASVAEKFETDLELEMYPARVAARPLAEILAEVDTLRESGRYPEALALVTAALEAPGADPSAGPGPLDAEAVKELRLYEIDCLVHLQRFESAKVEAERLLNRNDLSDKQRLWALLSFVTASYRLQRFTVARMGLEEVERELQAHDHPPRALAVTESIRGPALVAMGRFELAAAAFTRALEMFGELGDPFQTCKARVNLAQTLIELGEIHKARAHAREAARSAEQAGYDRLHALALSHLTVIHHRAEEPAPAESYALRSNAIARPREYISIMFRNCFYLREIAAQRGDLAAVRSNERTLKTYLGRVENDMPEAVSYRASLAGEQQ
jgi:tetratricopeptide (TPR) repeat protein